MIGSWLLDVNMRLLHWKMLCTQVDHALTLAIHPRLKVLQYEFQMMTDSDSRNLGPSVEGASCHPQKPSCLVDRQNCHDYLIKCERIL